MVLRLISIVIRQLNLTLMQSFYTRSYSRTRLRSSAGSICTWCQGFGWRLVHPAISIYFALYLFLASFSIRLDKLTVANATWMKSVARDVEYARPLVVRISLYETFIITPLCSITVNWTLSDGTTSLASNAFGIQKTWYLDLPLYGMVRCIG